MFVEVGATEVFVGLDGIVGLDGTTVPVGVVRRGVVVGLEVFVTLGATGGFVGVDGAEAFVAVGAGEVFVGIGPGDTSSR